MLGHVNVVFLITTPATLPTDTSVTTGVVADAATFIANTAATVVVVGGGPIAHRPLSCCHRRFRRCLHRRLHRRRHHFLVP